TSTAERVPQAFLAAGVGVGHELDPVARVDLLEALREEPEHAGPRLFGALGGDGDRDAAHPAQRNALLSLSKNPSLGPYVPARAQRPGVAFTAEADALAVVNAGRDLDLERAFLDHAARPPALLAGVLDQLAGAAAGGTGAGADELAEDAARDLPYVAAATAAR